MIPIRPQDARHKAQILRLLTEIADDSFLAQNLYFKGGTAASMLGFLDRFSVDLDFDLNPTANPQKVARAFLPIFSCLSLKIKDQSQKVPQFILQYTAPANQRNSLKLDAFGPVFAANVYRPQYLAEIDRLVNCQTIETMFANKLVAPLNRFSRRKTVAGRDIYDIHHFFYQGYHFEPKIITERTGDSPKAHLEKLIAFVKKHITEKTLNEDLNTLLLPEVFQKIRKTLKTETLTFLRDALASIPE